jgi:hypothetical protein
MMAIDPTITFTGAKITPPASKTAAQPSGLGAFLSAILKLFWRK